MAEGHFNRDIGDQRHISGRTVARHLTNIFHKIRVTNHTKAALYAVEHGITTSPQHQSDSLARAKTCRCSA